MMTNSVAHNIQVKTDLKIIPFGFFSRTGFHTFRSHVFSLVPHNCDIASSRLETKCKDSKVKYGRKWPHTPAEWGNIFVVKVPEDSVLILSLSHVNAKKNRRSKI
jgi:hypothetical protein